MTEPSEPGPAQVSSVGPPNCQPAELTEREGRYCLVASDAHLLHSSGQVQVQVWLSGIEAVGAEAWPETAEFALPAVRHRVVIHLIAWKDNPGSLNDDGTPSKSARPDLVALINPALSPPGVFRSPVETFDRPKDG
ncbi:hypothetical protein ACFWP7_08915 [Streptomyces sp. NPDC058470]|uniref:hypothetical protein n=1 Tax=Streptomyces sp. NPDC058470 TaxID=3346515 RepID=UPI00365C179E